LSLHFDRYAAESVQNGRVVSLPDPGADHVVKVMWDDYTTEIQVIRGGYSIFCYDTTLYPVLHRSGLSVRDCVVEFDFVVEGQHYTDRFDDLTEAYIALRLLYNLFEGHPLAEGLQ
jgi:hypothetical protein